MLPDEFKHSQEDVHSTYNTSGPNPGAVAPTPEPSRPFWERPETVSLELGVPPHGPGYGAPGVPPFPPFPEFPAHFPFFGRHHLHHHGPPGPPPPPPALPGVPGAGEHPDPPLPPPPPPPAPAPAPAQDPLASFGPWRNYLENIASWTQQAVNAYSGAGEHAHGHRHHGHHHLSHFGPPRGGHRGHHHESGSDGEGRRHRGPGGSGGPPRRGGWGSHRGRWGRGGGHRGCPHPEFIHPAMDIVSSDDAFTVTIELPGLTKEDVDISVHERALTVSGEFKPETAAPAPSPDLGGYPIGETEDEEDPFIDVDGSYEEKKKRKRDGFILKERRAGKFKRSIDLPSWVDAEKGIKASMTDGILTIVFTKGPESKAKKVTIL